MQQRIYMAAMTSTNPEPTRTTAPGEIPAAGSSSPVYPEEGVAAPFDSQRGDTMHRHLYLVRRPATQIPVRPAKVVQLEARRQARLEARRPTKPAA